jgi:magnesium transporter
MDKNFVTLNVSDDRRRAVDVFRKYDRPYIPVMDSEGLMIGLVEAEDVFDVAEEEATYDIQAFGGQSILPETYFKTSFLHLLQKRAGWLCAMFVLSMISIVILKRSFQSISGLGVLLLFVPMNLAAGGMAASQAAALTLRGLAVREIRDRDFWRLLLRESAIGLSLGLGLAVLLLGYGLYVERLSQALAFTVSFSVICNVFLGALIGSALPFLMRRFRFDPAISSAPVIAMIMDILGLLILLSIILIGLRSLEAGAT